MNPTSAGARRWALMPAQSRLTEKQSTMARSPQVRQPSERRETDVFTECFAAFFFTDCVGAVAGTGLVGEDKVPLWDSQTEESVPLLTPELGIKKHA